MTPGDDYQSDLAELRIPTDVARSPWLAWWQSPPTNDRRSADGEPLVALEGMTLELYGILMTESPEADTSPRYIRVNPEMKLPAEVPSWLTIFEIWGIKVTPPGGTVRGFRRSPAGAPATDLITYPANSATPDEEVTRMKRAIASLEWVNQRYGGRQPKPNEKKEALYQRIRDVCQNLIENDSEHRLRPELNYVAELLLISPDTVRRTLKWKNGDRPWHWQEFLQFLRDEKNPTR